MNTTAKPSRFQWATPFALGVLMLAGCGGGGSHASTVPVTAPAPAAAAVANSSVVLSITIPGKVPAAVAKRRTQYIASTTQSMSFAIVKGTAPVLTEAVGLTPSSPNCTVSGGNTVCTISLPLAPGAYTGSFSLYNGALVNNAVSGARLSAAQSVPIAVTAGQTNTVGLTLDGVPASLAVTPASGSLVTGTQAGGFLVPLSPQPMTVTAYDANGNAILGPGAPTFALNAAGYTLTQPTLAQPNAFTIGAASSAAGTLAVTATAPDGGYNCPGAGVTCTASAALTARPHELFVVNNASISVYTSFDDVNWTTVVGQNGNGSPSFSLGGAAVGSDGTLYVVNPGFPFPPANVSSYAPPYSGAPVVTSNGLNFPNDVGVAPNGTVVVAQSGSLELFTPPLTAASTPVTVSIGGNPFELAFLPGGDALLGLPNFPHGVTVRQSAPAYSATGPFSAVDGGSIGLDPAGDVYLGDTSTDDFSLWAPPYMNGVSTHLPHEGGSDMNAKGIVANAAGTWVQGVYSGSCPCTGWLFFYPAPLTAGAAPTQTISGSFVGSYQRSIAIDAEGDAMVLTSSSVVVYSPASTTPRATISTGISFPTSLVYVP